MVCVAYKMPGIFYWRHVSYTIRAKLDLAELEGRVYGRILPEASLLQVTRQMWPITNDVSY